ncbi:MAG: 50S ribosomal protein L2 [Candidatus Vogelbacteria bacterium RIFOXYD1_FULL_46_19]|uniref:Large ribosomal subunit protein uL2 n=1 Tax=Candidatus Vogelbacteria bacterium RIFOXYD1_FULL_46_19 TaxID=1802439 RepID=A0A1G2QH75_9BACT|nr:MAG: 50S ribosomal protein L2 [Candidatus Vogelbacteria bacterium RIFOXYD1_FULL_46_19]
MKTYAPTTPSRRHMSTVSYKKVLTVSEPHKKLVKGKKRFAGRNSAGRITVRHKGGGHKRNWREIDFKYEKRDIPATIKTIEYDPNRSAFIALVCYADGEYRYIVVPQNLPVGEKFIVSDKAEVKIGNRLPLKKIASGAFVYNVETKPEGGAKLIRSAGSYAEVLSNDAGYTTLKMPSGELRKLNENAWASIGAVSNEEYKLVNLGKAGRSRWLGIRPTVRGSAMNPVDHPHGGGEGRQGIGLRRGPKTREGKQAFGVRTRRAKKYSDKFIVARRKNKKRK